MLKHLRLAVAVLALTGLCIRLGFWQWHRMEEKDASAAAMHARLREAPIPLGRISGAEWTRVRVTGQFLPHREVTVKFMVRDGAPGVDVVTPLVLPGGTAVLVDRGWMASGNDDARPRRIPSAPRGLVTIEGWWRPDSEAKPVATEPIDRQVRAISSRGLQNFVGHPLISGYINQQQPKAPGLAREKPPRLTSTLNFFYALQWWFFAALAGIGLPWMAVKQAPQRRSSSATP